jgi:poly(A) polymerase
VIPPRLEPILAEVAPLAKRFTEFGFRIYLVGGTVRDAIDARAGAAGALAGADLDLTTDARPDDIERILRKWADAVWLQGKRFGTVGAARGVRRYEITTHRSEVYVEGSRKPEVSFGDDIVKDLSRRDFTINAMALELPGNVLIDPYGGVVDLAAGRLRTPLDPEVSFGDDPLRMMRAARFIAGRDLVPEPELVRAVEEMHDRLSIVSGERIRDELDKLIVVPDPSKGLWFLVRTGLAAEFLPELPALALEQDPIHRHKDVLAHTIAVVAKCSPDRVLRLAALFHDVGKPRTRSIGPEGVSFHYHDVVGARMTRNRMKALRYPSADIEQVSKLVELHLRFHTYRMGWTDSALRRYRTDAGDLIEELNELTRCDCTTRNEAKARDLSRRMDELERRLAELAEREAIDAIRPQLDGMQVMELLAIPPGRDVGAALEFLLEIRFEEGILPDEEIAERVRRWWEDRRRNSPPSGGRPRRDAGPAATS